MLESVGEIQIVEKINEEDFTTSVDIFKLEDKLKILRKANGSQVVWEGKADKFLTTLHWASQFLDTEKLPPLKDWRK